MKTSSIGWQTETLGVLRPETFRLPKDGVDPFFGLSRSFYYELEKRGLVRLIRIRKSGRQRGVTLIPFDAVEQFVRSQMEKSR
jgi:hypothetical protein